METGAAQQSVAQRLAGAGPAGLVYGAIVTAAVLVTVGGHDPAVGEVVATWAFVLVTYWLTHVYVHAAESQFDGDDRHLHHRAVVAARAELPVLIGGLPAIVVFVVVAATDTEVFEAARLSLLFTVALLAVFGFIGARHSGRGRVAACGEALGAGLLGVIMVLAKTLLH